jgi:hypothetical protein
MAKNWLGTLIGNIITLGDSDVVPYGTHVDDFGIGGYVTKATLADMYAIPVDPVANTINPDGLSSGRRKPGMQVLVLSDTSNNNNPQKYLLTVPNNYSSLSNANKYAALKKGDNSEWAKDLGGGILDWYSGIPINLQSPAITKVVYGSSDATGAYTGNVYIYEAIRGVTGHSTNPPSGTTADNTYWKYIGVLDPIYGYNIAGSPTNVTVGGLPAGTELSPTILIKDVIKKMLNVIYNRTVANVGYLSLNCGQSGGTYEIGSTVSVALTAIFNRGYIQGDYSSPGVWNPSQTHIEYLGLPSSYTINGTTITTTALSASKTAFNTVVTAYNAYSASVNYGVGNPITNSIGDTITAAPSAGSMSAGTAFSGDYYNFSLLASSAPSGTVTKSALGNLGFSANPVTINTNSNLALNYYCFFVPASKSTDCNCVNPATGQVWDTTPTSGGQGTLNKTTVSIVDGGGATLVSYNCFYLYIAAGFSSANLTFTYR